MQFVEIWKCFCNYDHSAMDATSAFTVQLWKVCVLEAMIGSSASVPESAKFG